MSQPRPRLLIGGLAGNVERARLPAGYNRHFGGAVDQMPLDELEAFIVAAKRRTYVGDGAPAGPLRPASHDLHHAEGDFVYHDCYFGGADFVGEEVVYWRERPVWAENYLGHILEPHLISAERAGQVIKSSLTKMYAEGRFLGGFEATDGDCTYHDNSTGDGTWFQGRECIDRAGRTVYELHYHGGLIRD
jgi:hypothetical protein